MRKVTLVILAAVAASLAVFVVVDDTEDNPTGFDATRLFPRFARHAVTEIVISGRSRRRLVVRREGDPWWIGSPKPRTLALRSQVERVLSALEFAESLRRLPKTEPDSRFGLDKARLRVRVSNGPHQTIDVAFGDADVSKTRVYVRVGQQDHLVSTALFEELDNDADTLRDRSMIPFSAQKVTAVTVTFGKSADPAQLKLVRHGHQWVVVKGDGSAVADWVRAQQWVGYLTSLTARRMAAADGSGGDGPKIIVRADGGTVVLQARGPCGDAFRPGRLLSRRWGDRSLELCVDERDWQQALARVQSLLPKSR